MALVLAPALSACTGLTPVYNTTGIATTGVALAYDAPDNRLEQIIYQDLSLRLGKAPSGVPAPKLSVSTGAGTHALTNGIVVTAQRPYQVTVTANIKVVDVNGRTLFVGSRSQTADLSENPQVLANQQAINDAAERAAHLLADTIRLTVLGALKQ